MKESKNLTLEAYEHIKKMMMTSCLAPGQRLKFKQLAERIGVSRTPVNNALHILAREGYLDFVPNAGYSVRRLTADEAKELHEIRLILEIGSIGKAIRRITDDKLLRVQQAKTACEQAIGQADSQKLYLLDTNFHAGLVAMADNPQLVRHYLEICRKAVLGLSTDSLPEERFWQICWEHEALFEAVRLRDVDGAKDLIYRHSVTPGRPCWLPTPVLPVRRHLKPIAVI